MRRAVLSGIFAVLVLAGGPPAATLADTSSGNAPVVSSCQGDPLCGLWAYFKSQGPASGTFVQPGQEPLQLALHVPLELPVPVLPVRRPGRLVDPYPFKWRYDDTIVYGVGRGPGDRPVGEIGVTVIVGALNGWLAPWHQETGVIDGPDVKMIHVYECREDHFIDATCPDPSGQQQHAETTYERVWLTGQRLQPQGGQFFWDFSFRWQAAGIEDCCFFIPKQSSFSYVGHTTNEQDPGAPCSFVQP